MIRRLVLLVVFATSILSADGPTYSRFGVGSLHWFGSSRTAALGGLGFGLRGEGFVNGANPAGLAGILYTRFDAAYALTTLSSKVSGTSAPYSMSGLQNLSVAIPVDTAHGVVIAFESSPYSSISYTTRRRDEQLGVSSLQTFYGRGGLSTLSFGASVTVGKGIHAGLRASYLFGRLQQFSSIDFDNSAFVDDEIDRSTYYNGFLLTAGSVVDLGSRPFGFDLPGNLSLGFVVTLPSSPTTDRYNAYLAIDTLLTSSGTGDIPMRIGAGMHLALGDRSSLIADVAMQDWSSVGTDAPGSLRSALRLSAGYEILPRAGEQSFFGQLGYRVGAGYEQSYVQVSGTGIDEIFGTVGLSIPIGPSGRLNTSIKAGVRGTTAAGLQQDTFVQLSLGITGNEIWFMTFTED